MLRLAHLSDIHLGPLPHVRRRDLMSKRITGYVNWQRHRGKAMADDTLSSLVRHMQCEKPDHIAVTGDLVNLALGEEIDNALHWLETVGDGKSVSVVPGNHDTYVAGALKIIRQKWAPYMRSDDAQESHFPYLRVRQGVALIGANSGRATLPFMATGSFKADQAGQLEKHLMQSRDAGYFRVVMIHHPPQKGATSLHKRLIGSGRFRATLAKTGADLILHGHTHLPTQTTIPGPDGPIPVIGVASASQSPSPSRNGHSRPPASYNLFDISQSNNSWTCEMRQFGFQPGGSEVVQLSPKTAII